MSIFRRSPAWDSVTYWSIDLETGGFDPRRDAILAVGMVPIRDGLVRLRESFRTLVRPDDGSAIDEKSIRAHQLVWGEVREAPPLPDVLREVDLRLRQGVMLVHFRRIELGFLETAFRRHRLPWPRPPVVDTFDLLLRRARLQNPLASPEDVTLNLSQARKEMGLPPYDAHDALTDAVSTAELFLKLRMAFGARTLRDVVA